MIWVALAGLGLLLIGVPVAFSLGLAGLIGVWLANIPFSIVATRLFTGVDSFVFLALAFGWDGLDFFEGQVVAKLASTLVLGLPIVLAVRRLAGEGFAGFGVAMDRPAFRLRTDNHIVFWEDGGPTEVWNTILLCPKHHKDVHVHGWQITLHPGGSVTVTSPEGDTYSEEAPAAREQQLRAYVVAEQRDVVAERRATYRPQPARPAPTRPAGRRTTTSNPVRAGPILR
jgi:hypothetical protein